MNQEHVDALRNLSKEEFNKWRAETLVTVAVPAGSPVTTTTPRLDLSGANLRDLWLYEPGYDLSWANVDGADFGGAYLRGCDLIFAWGENVRFVDTDLTDADLSHAKLAYSQFAKARLDGARLSGANLSHATFFETSATKAFFNGAELYELKCTGGNLSNSNFQGARFYNASFYLTRMCGVSLQGSEMRGAKFQGVAWYSSKAGVDLNGDMALFDNLMVNAAMIGIFPDDEGMCVAYRTTTATGRGRYRNHFVQQEGEYTDPNAVPAGKGTCTPGIHVTTPWNAMTYWHLDPTVQLWKVTFHVSDLLDCDGQKARIRKGFFERVNTSFFIKREAE